MELDLHQLIRIFRRRWWILAVLTLIIASIAYWVSSQQTPLYQSTATIVVNPGALVGSNESTSIQDSQRLTATYVRLINTQPMRDRVMQHPGIETLDKEDVSVNTVSDTLLITITVTHTDPDQAALIANTYVSEFQEYIRDQNNARIAESRSRVDEQIVYLNGLIGDIEEQLETASEGDIADLQQQRRTFIEMVTQLESDAAQSEMDAASASTFIEPVDPAEPPGTPSSPNIPQATVLGAFVGILLAVGLIALLEFLDNTVKSHTNIQDLTDSHTLASIPVNPGIKRGTRQVFVIADPNSVSAEAIRLLRTNLNFAGIDAPISSVAITSSLAAEGKSTVAANLAVAVAHSGKSVALIDADLRIPTQYEIFGVDGSRGVTTFLADRSMQWQDVAQRVAVPGLVLIPTGPIPPNPAEMIGSGRFNELIHQLRTEFDLVILDTPPVLQASDGLIAGSLTDGLIVVTQHGKTRTDALKGAASLIHQSRTRLIGVVLNRVEKSDSGYYGEYYGTKR